jgi:predicted  nucleic acid-binding Zn-ribbon protein
MKSTLFTLAVLIAFVLAGCGKSEVQKKLESELNNEVTKVHDAAMATMTKGKDLASQLDGAVAIQDSLTKLYPKAFEGKTTDDLKAAKEKLAGVKDEMDKWMKGHKAYDPNGKHEELLAQLKKDKEDLTKIKGDVEGAFAAATTAIDSHKQLVADVTAKTVKTVKKVVKK